MSFSNLVILQASYRLFLVRVTKSKAARFLKSGKKKIKKNIISVWALDCGFDQRIKDYGLLRVIKPKAS